MSLVGIYRNAGLAHRVRKAYVIDGAGVAARVVAGVAATRTESGHVVRVANDDEHNGVVWIDTGAMDLVDPEAREELRQALVRTVATLGEAAARAGGQLLPVGWRPRTGATAPCAAPDLHTVEVVDGVHREILVNLLRRHVPELVALTGRGALGLDGLDSTGSRRIARSVDTVETRYLASASPAHLERVRASLRRDAGVARLESMDVNPVDGDCRGAPTVTVRCIDAQILPRTTVAHALLVQALAVRAGILRREGRRVPAVDQGLLDRNRHRAAASGIRGELDDPDAAIPDRRRGTPARAPASALVDRLLEGLDRELAALSVQAAEIAPLTSGMAVPDVSRALRNENDLVLDWCREMGPEPVAQGVPNGLLDPDWLDGDHVSARNRARHPGAAELADAVWTDRLAASRHARPATRPTTRPAARATPTRTTPTTSRTARRPPTPHRPPAASADPTATLLAALTDAESVVDVALRDFVGSCPRRNLVPDLKKIDRDHARELRKRMRPTPERTLQTTTLPDDWSDTAFAALVEQSRQGDRTLFRARVTRASWEQARMRIYQEITVPPPDVELLLVTAAVFGEREAQSVSVEILVVPTGTTA